MRLGKSVLLGFGILWLIAVGAGLWVLFHYETSPGEAARPPVQWPAESEIPRAPGRATLVMVAHPHCPCTRASIGELALLMARLQGQVPAYVLFLKPTGVAEDWPKTDLWRSSAAIPGVTVMGDEGGVEAARFRATVSGQTFLYDVNGRLLFSGGITASRGHSGGNAGRSAIVHLVTKGVAERTQTSVFGCSLHDPNPRARQVDRSWKR